MHIRAFPKRSLLRFVLLCTAILIAPLAGPAWAQKFPSRPITLVCPFAPGGSADIMARLIGQKLGDALGVPVVVENKPGAGSAVGSSFVAKAKPDGHTLILLTGAYTAQAALAKTPMFDPLRDISMVSMVTSYPFILSVTPDAPYRTLSDLIARAKANPGKLNYSSTGIGSIHHLSSELLSVMAGIELVHIPTKGGSAALTELLSGRIDLLLEAPTLSLPYIKSGKLRALAVTGRERSKNLPDLPTVAETLPGYDVISYIGVGVTGGTPDAIVQQLNAELRRIVDSPDTAKRLIDLGGDPQANTPVEMQRFVESELRKWRSVIDARKIERQ